MTFQMKAAIRLMAAKGAAPGESFTLNYLYRIYHNQKLRKVGSAYVGDVPQNIADKMHIFFDSNGFKKVGNTYKGHDEEVKMTPGRLEGYVTIAVKTSGSNIGSQQILNPKGR
jgi:hypothetical protein